MTTVTVEIRHAKNDDARMLAKVLGTARNNLGEAGTIRGWVSSVRMFIFIDFDRPGSIGRGSNKSTINPENLDYDALFNMEHSNRVGTYEIVDDGSWKKVQPWQIRLGAWRRVEGPFACDAALTKLRN